MSTASMRPVSLSQWAPIFDECLFVTILACERSQSGGFDFAG